MTNRGRYKRSRATRRCFSVLILLLVIVCNCDIILILNIFGIPKRVKMRPNWNPAFIGLKFAQIAKVCLFFSINGLKNKWKFKIVEILMAPEHICLIRMREPCQPEVTWLFGTYLNSVNGI